MEGECGSCVGRSSHGFYRLRRTSGYILGEELTRTAVKLQVRKEVKRGNNCWLKKGRHWWPRSQDQASWSPWKGKGKLHRTVDFHVSPCACSLSISDVYPVCRLLKQPWNRTGSQGHHKHPQWRGMRSYLHAPWDDNVALLKQAAAKRPSWTQAWLGFHDWETASAVARIHFWSHFFNVFSLYFPNYAYIIETRSNEIIS